MSLDEVANFVARGMSNSYVRKFATDKLAEAKRMGVSVDSPRARAEVLLRVFQNEKLWVPDPVNAEHITEAHLIACDPKTPHVGPDGKALECFEGEDCDGKVVGFLACLGSVGIHCAVVGHSYDEDKHIEHVLGVAWIGKRWYYADPSLPELALGQCVPFTRERVLSVPNVQVICDDRACIQGHEHGFNPDDSNFVSQGVFVGVGAPPTMAGLTAKVMWQGSRLEWLGEVEQQSQQVKPMTTVEKVLLISTIISGATLAINIYDHMRG